MALRARSPAHRLLVGGALALALSLDRAAPLAAQEIPPPEPAVEPASAPRFRFSGELKLDLRWSKDLISPIFTPFPDVERPVPPTQRTVDPGTSFEFTTVNLRGEGELTPDVFAKAEIHILDLHNRNPTSSDDRILVREGWVRFGPAMEPLAPKPGRAYVLVGLAPRFTKQLVRHLESYGMWGTAVGRFEQLQLQAGVRLGEHFYAKAMVGNGNPLFLRDTNALAGDNGTPERVPGSPDRTLETGLPILYDAKASNVSLNERVEWGGGLGSRFELFGASVDALAWYFERRMSDTERIRGSELPGELELLDGEGYPLPYHGNQRHEWGVNVYAKAGAFSLFAQWVDQTLAGLRRRGYEAEVAWLAPLPGLFVIGDTVFINWVQPAVRVSYIDNLFEGQFQFPSLSIPWDWLKIDVGVRLGIVRNVDLTVEYSRHDAYTVVGTLHPDEFLALLRVGF